MKFCYRKQKDFIFLFGKKRGKSKDQRPGIDLATKHQRLPSIITRIQGSILPPSDKKLGRENAREELRAKSGRPSEGTVVVSSQIMTYVGSQLYKYMFSIHQSNGDE